MEDSDYTKEELLFYIVLDMFLPIFTEKKLRFKVRMSFSCMLRRPMDNLTYSKVYLVLFS